ncbi:NADH-dependent butanol dehydrogenase A [uncultured Ruminococcus sp.]|nr:NADH-dependent butanol dehydrogenase A [uncultured Ruminococcus sp.]SCI19674.1 NADH-dependent butanol dehydrogenase A [uncultured Clostridium sp.]
MLDFSFQVPTQVYFGLEADKEVGKYIKEFGGSKVLIHYGSHFSKKSGLVDRIIGYLKSEKLEVVELGGVLPNPRLGLVRQGIEICRKEKVDFILAVGGGSVIDSAKGIALGVPYDGDVWDFYSGKQLVEKLLPLGSIVTLPATGSEVAVGSVVTNEEGMQKVPLNHPKIRPQFAILNPRLTLSIPPYQTACGIADIMAHVMENYFSNVENTDFTDRLCEACLKTMIHNGRVVAKQPEDLAARSEIMWVASVAQAGLLNTGRQGDWASHDIENELSAVYDAPHGGGLAVVFPGWMKYVYRHNLKVFVRFATRVWGVDPSVFEDDDAVAREGIRRLSEFFAEIGLPSTLEGLRVPVDRLDEIAQRVTKGGTIGNFVKLSEQDVLNIYHSLCETR